MNSLIELEESLSKINSARNQVSNVADKSEQLISAFMAILEQLESIDDNLGLDKGEFKERLDDSINSLNHRLLEVSSNVSLKSIELNRQLDDMVFLFSEKLELLKGEFKERLDNSFENLNQELRSVSSAVSSKSSELFNDLDITVSLFLEKVESLNRGIENFNKELQATENRISELDLKKDLMEKFVQCQNESNDLFQRKMNELEVSFSAKFMWNLIAVIVGLGLLTIVMFFK